MRHVQDYATNNCTAFDQLESRISIMFSGGYAELIKGINKGFDHAPTLVMSSAETLEKSIKLEFS